MNLVQILKLMIFYLYLLIFQTTVGPYKNLAQKRYKRNGYSHLWVTLIMDRIYHDETTRCESATAGS